MAASPKRGDDSRTESENRTHAPRNEFEARAQEAVADLEAKAQEAISQFEATNEKIRRRTGRNLLAAIGIGILLGGGFLVSLIIFKQLFIVFGGALAAFTIVELASALRFAGRDVPRTASTVVGVVVMVLAFFFGMPGLWLGTIGAIVLVTLYRLVEQAIPATRTDSRNLLLDLGAGAFVQLYVTFLAGFYLALTAQDGGQWWTLAAMIIVVGADTGAYVTGLSLGRHKMAPTISPGKTWEGFAGALVTGIVGGVILGIFMLHEPWWIGVVFGVVLTLIGVVGDLIESLIKRDLGIKDISSWLPGHGGFLDRLDSILPSAAAAWVFFVITR